MPALGDLPEWRMVDGACEGCGSHVPGYDRDGVYVTIEDHMAAHRRGWAKGHKAVLRLGQEEGGDRE